MKDAGRQSRVERCCGLVCVVAWARSFHDGEGKSDCGRGHSIMFANSHVRSQLRAFQLSNHPFRLIVNSHSKTTPLCTSMLMGRPMDDVAFGKRNCPSSEVLACTSGIRGNGGAA